MNSIAHINSATYDASVPRPPVGLRPWSLTWIAHQVLRRYNQIRHVVLPAGVAATGYQDLAEIRTKASSVTDIDEHLERMFFEALLCRPRLTVELGVRNGASTFVFTRVARHCGSILLSCDLDDCTSASTYPGWHFVQKDDIEFARDFPHYCRDLGIAPSVDLLFVDTSHYYDHTVQEIAAWFPLLSDRAKVIFHDTNLRTIGPRRDGCFALGWDNQRGVIRAIEEFLGIRIDEHTECIERASGWLVRHWPNCNGLTILDRLPSIEGE